MRSPPFGTLSRVRRSVGLAVPRDAGRRGAHPRPPRHRAAVGIGAADGQARRAADRHVPDLEFDDSHTLSRSLATGGYEALRKALSMTPARRRRGGGRRVAPRPRGRGVPGGSEVVDAAQGPTCQLPRRQRRRVRARDLQGPPAAGARSAPAGRGRRDRGVGAAGLDGFIYVRGEFALGIERVQSAVNDAYAHGALGADIFGSGFSLDVVVHPGAGAYICGDETGLLESLEGKRGFPRIKPPFFPAVDGPLRPAHGREQRRDALQRAVDRDQRRPRVRRARRGPLDGHTTVRAGRARQPARRLRARDGAQHVP